MHTLSTPQSAREFVWDARVRGKTVGIVPTMGALHRGHQGLMQQALDAGDALLVSIFVNPTQFGEGEDFEGYPRDERADLSKVAEVSPDGAVFLPTVPMIYPPGFSTAVSVSNVGEPLCGSSRPGHFDGVATVVSRLFGLVRPTRAYFGEKDYQQLTVIRQVVRDLALPVEVVGVSTIREADGLALSSRNTYLTAAEREVAASLYRAIRSADSAWRSGERSVERLCELARAEVDRSGFFRVDYIEVVDAGDLSPLKPGRAALMAIAAWLGRARLIDNGVLGR